MTERDLVQAILIEFGSRPDLRLWRANAGAAIDRRGAMIRFGVPGQADLSGIMEDGTRIEIEAKTATGRQSRVQKNWQRMIEKFNGIYILARSVEDVRRVLDPT